MLRDAAHRAYDPRKTLTHWHYVRSSEMRNIIPYINTADYLINSAMPYEMPLYSHKLRDSFAEWSDEFEGDPLREDWDLAFRELQARPGFAPPQP